MHKYNVMYAIECLVYNYCNVTNVYELVGAAISDSIKSIWTILAPLRLDLINGQ